MGLPIGQTAPRRTPVVTLTLIAINVIVYIIMNTCPSLLVPGASSVYEVQRQLAMIPAAIVQGDRLWTLFTSMFVHADFLHLFGNMIFLFFFGASVENAMGKLRYLVFYFLCGLAAALFHILSISFIPAGYLIANIQVLNPWITPTLGASGAISGIMGAYLVYYPRARVVFMYPILIFPFIFALPAWAYILIWFTYQLFMGLITLMGFASSIAFWAHIGGFLAGIALAPVFLDPTIKEKTKIYREFLLRYNVSY